MVLIIMGSQLKRNLCLWRPRRFSIIDWTDLKLEVSLSFMPVAPKVQSVEIWKINLTWRMFGSQRLGPWIARALFRQRGTSSGREPKIFRLTRVVLGQLVANFRVERFLSNRIQTSLILTHTSWKCKAAALIFARFRGLSPKERRKLWSRPYLVYRVSSERPKMPTVSGQRLVPKTKLWPSRESTSKLSWRERKRVLRTGMPRASGWNTRDIWDRRRWSNSCCWMPKRKNRRLRHLLEKANRKVLL